MYASEPKIKLLYAGLSAGVSPSYTLHNFASIDEKEKNSLRGMTLRAVTDGLTVMENAARGRFPCFHDFNHGVTRKTLSK